MLVWWLNFFLHQGYKTTGMTYSTELEIFNHLKDMVQEVRSWGVPRRRNIAAMCCIFRTGHTLWCTEVSGRKCNGGDLDCIMDKKLPCFRIHHNRNSDAEYLLANFINNHEAWWPVISEIRIYSEWEPCHSCQHALETLRDKMGRHISVLYGRPYTSRGCPPWCPVCQRE